MKNIIQNKKLLCVISLIVILAIIIGVFSYRSVNLLNKSEFNDFEEKLEEESLNFESQADFRHFLITWAKEKGLKYSIDDSKNIIFDRKSSTLKNKTAPTVTVVNYNYETANSNRKILTSAAMIALTDVNAGRSTVIFVNNKKNDGSAYLNLDESYFNDNSKVIYLDYGGGAYISNSSFGRKDTLVSIPGTTDEAKYDTAIKIKISGITSDVISANIGSHTNPINNLGVVLLRIKSKSISAQLADLKVDDRGNMYPESVEFTILMNSYSVPAFTSYLDGKIENFEKSIDEDINPNAEYSYEILENVEENVDTVYSKKSLNALTTLLYTVKNDNYRFKEEDEFIPQDYSNGDIYAINCINRIIVDDNDSSLHVGISTQALDKSFMKLIMDENKEAIRLSKCSIENTQGYPVFSNKNTGLSRTIKSTYFKVNDLSGTDATLRDAHDTYFTPMTYLRMLNKNMEIVHIKESSKTCIELTNTILCYIKTKGNLFTL